MIKFELTPEQEKTLNEWMQDKDSYSGAIGGDVTFQFTPTSIGVIEKVIYFKGTSKEAMLDLTDYDSGKGTVEMKSFVFFDDMTWPNPESDIEWHLRYGDVEEYRFRAASYVAAYNALINMPQKLRNKRIEQIKKEAVKLRNGE